MTTPAPTSIAQFLPPRTHEWSPLPKDYPELTSSGQREARLHVCHAQSTPAEVVQAWDFFRRYYLLGHGTFYKAYRESPPFHYKMVYDAARFSRNICGAPRGSAKSSIKGRELPLLYLCTRPRWYTTLCLATDPMVGERLEDIKEQLDDNDLLINDFGVLRTDRGKGSWSKHNLRLKNGARLLGISAGSKMRGGRPDLFILDDPEDEREGKVSAEKLRRDMERLIFKVILGMLERGCACDWTGTLIYHSSFLYYAAYGGDPRFDYWNKCIYGAGLSPDENGECRLLWPSRWSRTYLERRRLEMGSANYSAEMENKPVTDEERIFRRDPDDTYEILGEWQSSPHASGAIIHSVHFDPRTGEREERREQLSKFLSHLFIVMTVDYASTVGPLSDYSAIHIIGFDRDNTLWSLDLWAGKVHDAALVDKIFELGTRWEPRIVGCEAPTIAYQVRERLHLTPVGMGWRPRSVIKVNYPRAAGKSERAAGEEWRFNSHRIKFPRDRQSNKAYNMLFTQIDNFTRDLALLDHDDCLDTITMTQYVVHSRGIHPQAPAAPTRPSPVRKSGVPALSGVNAAELSGEQIDRMLDAAHDVGYTGEEEETCDVGNIPVYG